MPNTKKPQSNTTERPPTVAIMGHIDHGKSTLLDYIRKSNVADKEVGGITQNMSAYEVIHASKKITFLDTPGHESFSQLRSRGANVADLAVLVVSAEDGVKPQTLDALKSITEAKLPYIVAINKIDKAGADIERTKLSLAEHNVFVEGYGGTISCVPISAKVGTGVSELLDLILLTAEMSELQGDVEKPAEGIVIETNRDRSGISASMIIKNGTLKRGDVVVAGNAISPVRMLEDFAGRPIDSATFSSPVRVIGFSEMPKVGSPFHTFDSKKEAEKFVAKTASEPAHNQINQNKIQESPNVYILPIIIKASTSGVIEAIDFEINKIKNDRIAFKVLYSGIGDISENDIKIASGKEGTLVIGFATKVDGSAKALAERLGVQIQVFDIIYKLTEWLAQIALERTPKMEVEEQKGRVKILKFFSRAKDRQVIGGRVEEGVLTVGDTVRILRRDVEIGRGSVREIQQAKAKTSEVLAGTEFGAMIESKIELAPGDKVEPFHTVSK
ncbi:MAG: translation initiation factor IF-2 [Candidatus Pacebacteria bacterium]|nr:translation initiation factor IF-2 [Candidatus Paceibacterota bacterium]